MSMSYMSGCLGSGTHQIFTVTATLRWLMDSGGAWALVNSLSKCWRFLPQTLNLPVRTILCFQITDTSVLFVCVSLDCV